MRYRKVPTLIWTAALAACGGGGAAVTAPPEPPPAVLSTLALTPASGTVQVGGTMQLTATPRDAIGNQLAGGPAPTFATSDAAKATVSPAGMVTGVDAGPVTITATLAWGGVTRTANAAITVTAPAPPAGATVTTQGITFSPSVVTIAPGASVTWQIAGTTHNVTFSGAAPTGGNVPDTQAGGSATRTFPAAGTYDYQCTRHSGMTGRVVVQ